jgi:hypothetical protein
LVRQPHGFEGLLDRREGLHPRDLPGMDLEDLGKRIVERWSASHRPALASEPAHDLYVRLRYRRARYHGFRSPPPAPPKSAG